MPQGWLLEPDDAPPDDEPPGQSRLRSRLRSDSWLDPEDLARVPDVDPGRTAATAKPQQLAEGDPEFFGNHILNDTSLVLQFEVFLDARVRRRLLLTGDMENWTYLLGRHSRGLECDLLKAPHHGGRVYVEGRESYDEIYQWLRPEIVLVSAAGRHDLPRAAFREVVQRWGATLICPNRRGSEVVFGPSPEDKSCFVGHRCQAEQVGTKLRITAESITADSQACVTGIRRGAMPVISLRQELVVPSGILDRLTSQELERHTRWIQKKLDAIHDGRVAVRCVSANEDLQPVRRNVLERLARNEDRGQLTNDIEQVLVRAARRSALWHESNSNRQGKSSWAYRLPHPNDIQTAQRSMQRFKLMLLQVHEPTFSGVRTCDDLLDSLATGWLARKLAHETFYPPVMFRAAFWPKLAPTLQQNYDAWTVRKPDSKQDLLLLMQCGTGANPRDEVLKLVSHPSWYWGGSIEDIERESSVLIGSEGGTNTPSLLNLLFESPGASSKTLAYNILFTKVPGWSVLAEPPR